MRTASVVILVVSLATVLSADDWPHWRGPFASGLSSEKGLPVEWSDRAGVAWRSPVRGLGISSPIISGNLVFVTSQLGSGESRQGPRLMQSGNALEAGERPLGPGPAKGGGKVSFLITAFDRTTGSKAWEHEAAGGRFADCGAREAQSRVAKSGHGWNAGVCLVRHRPDCGGRSSAASSSGRRTSRPTTLPSTSTGAMAARRWCTATCCSCSAITTRRRTCWRSTRARARSNGRPTRRAGRRRTARRW